MVLTTEKQMMEIKEERKKQITQAGEPGPMGRTIDDILKDQWSNNKPEFKISLMTDGRSWSYGGYNGHNAYIGTNGVYVGHVGVDYGSGMIPSRWTLSVGKRKGKGWEVALKHRDGFFLSAEGTKGIMSVQPRFHQDEKFILSGWERKASLQRSSDSGNDSRGFVLVSPVSRNGKSAIGANGTANQHTHFWLVFS